MKDEQQTRDRSLVQSWYTRLSGVYDFFAGSEDRFCQRGLQMLAVQPGEEVLEIGFGTGIALLQLARQAGPRGTAVGVDLSPGMIRVTQEKVNQSALPHPPLLTLGDAVWLPYPTGCFDAVFTSFALELFTAPEIPRVLAECQRVLRPAGRLGVVSLARPDQANPVVSAYEWVHQQFPNVVDCHPIRVQRFIQQAGFAIQQAHTRLMWGLPVDMVIGVKKQWTSA